MTLWFEAHAAPLVLYAQQWLERGQAEDAVQEVFVRLMLRARPPENVKAWLYRAVRNRTISQWRAQQRRQAHERNRASNRADFDSASTLWIDAQAVDDALENLSPQEREVVVLRTWGQMTLVEISEIVGSSLTSVYRQYHQGLAVIRERLENPCKNKTP